MNCAVHADREAVGFCRNCGKAMCSDCTHPVKDVLYCEDCLAKILGHSVPPVGALTQTTAPAPHVGASPGLAFVLGLSVPGLGAVYNGEYNKALVHIVVFAAMIVGLSSGASEGSTVMLALLLAGFIFYMAFDAMRTAQARNAGQTASDPLASWSTNRPIGPILLIVLGVLFLLGNFDFFNLDRIFQFWPVILIVAGLLMLGRRLSRSS